MTDIDYGKEKKKDICIWMSPEYLWGKKIEFWVDAFMIKEPFWFSKVCFISWKYFKPVLSIFSGIVSGYWTHSMCCFVYD